MADNDIIDDELDPCPDDEVLRGYLSGNLKPSWVERAIKTHVALCPSCKGRIKNMDRDDFIKRAAERLQRQAENVSAKREAVAGSVWRTVPETEDELYGPLVLVLEVEKDRLQVAEASEGLDQALDSDMILDKGKSGLSFRCMVRAGNLVFIKADRLKGYAGTLPKELVERVREFCLHHDEFKDRIKLSQCRFGKDREGRSLMMREGIISGMPAASDADPRVKFLEESRERIAYLKKNILTPTEALDDVVHKVWKGVQGPEAKEDEFSLFREYLRKDSKVDTPHWASSSKESQSRMPIGWKPSPPAKPKELQSSKEPLPDEKSITERSPSVGPIGEVVSASIPISEAKSKSRRRYVLLGSIAAGLLAVVVTTAALRTLLTSWEGKKVGVRTSNQPTFEEFQRRKTENSQGITPLLDGDLVARQVIVDPPQGGKGTASSEKTKQDSPSHSARQHVEIGRPLPSVGGPISTQQGAGHPPIGRAYTPQDGKNDQKPSNVSSRHLSSPEKPDQDKSAQRQVKGDMFARAVIAGNVADVRRLLDDDGGLIDLPVASLGFCSPLLIAAKDGRIDLVKLLIERGANINVTDEKAMTPLMLAARHGHVGTVKLLLDKGANRSLKDQQGQTALGFALDAGHQSVVELLWAK